MVNVFHCYEYLFLSDLDFNPEFWDLIKETILKKNERNLRVIFNEYWYVALTFEETNGRFPAFVKNVVSNNLICYPGTRNGVLNLYIQTHNFTEMYLDNLFHPKDKCELPVELFKCPSLRVLSLRYNFLESLPADIGKLQKLEHLALTSNKLDNSSVPFSLSFCTNLKILLLDDNLLDALPGYLLRISNLNTVHRHGNHNYFKATFMWYHTNVNERILGVPGGTGASQGEFPSLKELCATTIIGSKMNFFASSSIPPGIVDYLCEIYSDYNICYRCPSAKLKSKSGYKVYTFENPYLGNYCVPFQHWACSLKCAKEIELPAKEKQLKAAREQDLQYCKYIRDIHLNLSADEKPANRTFSCSIL